MGPSNVSAASAQSPLGPMPQDPKARLKKAATALEGIWLTQMLKEARPKGGMLDKSFAAQTFKDMMDQALGDSMASTGVLGLADALVGQLSARHPNLQGTAAPPTETPPPPATGEKS